MTAAAAETTTDIVQRTPAQQLVARISGDAFRDQVARALPQGTLLPERFQRATATALLANPDLANLDEASLFNSLLRCAQDGLLPDGREAAIVAYKDKAQYVPMIGGYRKIAGDHGWSIRTVVVYANDEFEVELGIDPKIKHIPVRPGAERGERVAVYAVGAHGDGRREIEVMYAADVQKRQAKAKTQAIWNEWPDRMWEKTAGKALFEKLPIGELDERVARVIAAEDTTPEAATALMYGDHAELPTPTPQPAADDGPPVEAVVDQQAGADAEGTTAEASAPEPLPGEPVDEPEQKPIFKAPAGAVSEDADALKIAADTAGQEVIGLGGHKGKSIEAVAAAGGKGESWVGWAIKTPDFAHSNAAKAYARVYLPEVYTAALAELQIAAEVR